MSRCLKCGDDYLLREGQQATTFCDVCAQAIIEGLEELIPEPPATITVEKGVEILNALQKELWDRPYDDGGL